MKKYAFKSVTEMSIEYRYIYDNSSDSPHKVDCEALKQIIKEEKFLAPSNYVNSNAVYVLNEIMSSTKWRLVSKLKIPHFISGPIKKVFRLVKRLLRG